MDEQQCARVDHRGAGERNRSENYQFHRSCQHRSCAAKRQYHHWRPDLPVNQAAAACSYSLKPGSYNASAAGGSSSFEVNTAAGCGWTSSGVPAWITGVPASGTGPTAINFTVAANTDPTPRSANIAIGGQTFTVTQAAAACSYSLNPPSHNRRRPAAPSSVDVTPRRAATGRAAACRRGSRGTGERNGDDDNQFHRRRQPRPASRTANITIGGQPFTVTQARGRVQLFAESAQPQPRRPAAPTRSTSRPRRAATGRAAACRRGSPACRQRNRDDDHQFHRRRQPRPTRAPPTSPSAANLSP